ncbi:MAG: hypothetical protein WAM30_12260 [Candidatus Dormiibacterota bacterium]
MGATAAGVRRVPRHVTVGWALLLLLALFPVLSASLDLVADVSRGIPSDHQAAFAALVGRSWNSIQHAAPGTAGYITLLEIGYAIHELVFGVLFLVIVAIPFRRGEWWAWWACWVVLVADLAYTLTFGRHDAAILRQSLVADIALPVLLLWQLARFRT